MHGNTSPSKWPPDSISPIFTSTITVHFDRGIGLVKDKLLARKESYEPAIQQLRGSLAEHISSNPSHTASHPNRRLKLHG